MFNEIDWIHDEKQGWLPHMTILYDGREDIQIVKLMVGVVHDLQYVNLPICSKRSCCF
jgi:hypothetical protein